MRVGTLSLEDHSLPILKISEGVPQQDMGCQAFETAFLGRTSRNQVFCTTTDKKTKTLKSIL